MSKSIVRLALIAVVAVSSITPAFADKGPSTEKTEVKTEVKQEVKSADAKEVKTEVKEKKKDVTKKKSEGKKCCQVKVENL